MTSRTHTPEDIKKIQKEWVGLTDEEIDNCAMDAYTTEMANAMVTGVVNVRGVNIGIAKAIEAKLKEKNT
jgi:hypothetical protein